ncbi:MAG: ribosomal protein S18-alanine N-acetyltransferase [Clostridia bacterium]|nr:ribosomal protein S18-alanine N-acetyltransferase [Clostridia bacterium]MBR6289931.1 ribosomal protein S18-alanine N-acetyltransferase [Clostridia bacterium]
MTEYRPACAEDDFPLEEVMRIERASFTVPWTEDDFLTLLSRDYAVTLVASDGGTVTGYGCAVSVADEAEILNLAVDGEMRRRGVGRELLGRLVRAVSDRGARRIFLEVRRSNAAARALYASFGFGEIGVRQNYYRLPVEDAILMYYDADAADNGDGTSK